MSDHRQELPEDPAADRREFLKTAGKFAVVVPPVMTFLLSTTMSSDAIANSCNNGIGLGAQGDDCVPGHSSNNDDNTQQPGDPLHKGGSGGGGGNPHG